LWGAQSERKLFLSVTLCSVLAMRRMMISADELCDGGNSKSNPASSVKLLSATLPLYVAHCLNLSLCGQRVTLIFPALSSSRSEVSEKKRPILG
jgi:hypothetical protein